MLHFMQILIMYNMNFFPVNVIIYMFPPWAIWNFSFDEHLIPNINFRAPVFNFAFGIVKEKLLLSTLMMTRPFLRSPQLFFTDQNMDGPHLKRNTFFGIILIMSLTNRWMDAWMHR